MIRIERYSNDVTELRKMLRDSARKYGVKRVGAYLRNDMKIYQMTDRYLQMLLNGEKKTNIPPDIVLGIMLATKDCSALEYLANCCGKTLVDIPEPKLKLIDIINKALARTNKEFGEYTLAVSKAIMDDKITNSEMRNIEKECEESHKEILRMLKQIKLLYEKNK